jgi:hypothetical protein
VKFSHQVNSLQNTTINKEQAIRLYKSQLNDEICAEIVARMNTLQGERVWGEEQIIMEFKKMLKDDPNHSQY